MAIYQGLILEHFRRPRNRGPLQEAEAIGEAVNPLCGDVLQLFLAIDSDRIVRASFVADACAVCIASASMLTEAVQGRPVPEISRMTADDVLTMLAAPLPSARHQCAALPLTAMRRALGALGATHQVPDARGTGVAAIVLAAGAGSRFGGGKLSALVRGEPIVRRSVRAVIGAVDHVIVVVGAEADPIRMALAEIDVAFAINERPSDGMSRSIRTGIEAASAIEGTAALIVLGDQPFIPPDAPRALSNAWRLNHPAIVVPRYDGISGHPVLFDRRTFPELMALTGDSGARSVVEQDSTRVAFVELSREIPRDVDTPADLSAFDSTAKPPSRDSARHSMRSAGS